GTQQAWSRRRAFDRPWHHPVLASGAHSREVAVPKREVSRRGRAKCADSINPGLMSYLKIFSIILKLAPPCAGVAGRPPSGRHEKARFRALEHEAGQPAGRKRSGVDVDPVW